MLVPGDRVTISGRPAVILSYDSLTSDLSYALEGKSIRKVLDAGLAMSDENEFPEVEVYWKSKGEPAGKTRLPPRRRPV